MSSDERVAMVVQKWAGLPALPKDIDYLKVIWANSGNAAPFQKDAVQDLINRLKEEFKNPPSKHVILETTDVDPGSIKKVRDLKDAVAQMP